VTTATSSWLVRRSLDATVRLRLVCVPQAGGSAAVFRDWHLAVAPDVEVVAVQLPGRGERWREPLLMDLESVVDALEFVLGTAVEEPFALFGHCLGAPIVLELAKRVRRDHGREPLRMFVAGSDAPVPGRPMPTLSGLSDDELRERLVQLGAPRRALEDGELADVILSVVRADCRIGDSYVCPGYEPLTCPIVVFHSTRDPMVSTAGLSSWRRHTIGPVEIHEISGGHGFDERGWHDVLRIISGELDGARDRDEE
jgi:medium-chain acyl-[acyl-carrier-protein] hydrolase